ncbi:MAG: hypothetical protein GEV28_34385 [Actinophytocola sp.]|uniref:hypothetical protein n=1 Tax=Actinophytocola sp. TaxID=1872138 RepID=UPI001322E021|nr:hypothetical protein [Actinophytocola sp.]MPZ85204.1 hypothetical protein [Actinophytocola sp.]
MARDRGAESLATSLAQMARDLLGQDTVQDTLDRIVTHAVSLVEVCEFAGLLAVEGGRPRTLAATADAACESDRIQVELGEGPCLDSTRQHVQMVYRIDDIDTVEDRWPRYAPKARELGIGSRIALPRRKISTPSR